MRGHADSNSLRHLRLPLHADQALLQPLKVVTQFPRIEAELREDQRLQIADADRVFGDVVAQFVGFAVDLAALDAAAGQHHREGIRDDDRGR